MREASSRRLMEALWDAGARVRAYDPVAMTEARRIYGERPDLELVDDPLTALDGADGLAIVTEWNQFRGVDFATLKDRLKTPVVFDGRNLYNPQLAAASGLNYYSIGRVPTLPV